MMCKKERSFLNHSKIRLAVVYFSVLLSAPLFGCTDNGGSSPLECREDGQTLCVGKRFRVCDGRQWGAFQDCPKGQVCTDSTTCGEEEASPNPKAGDPCDPQSWSDMCDTSDPKAKLVCGSNGLIEHISCPVAGQSCHEGTCVCETLDSKFTYDATCNKTGCTDSALKFDGVDCVAATDPCDGVDCHDGTCSEGTCDCSALDGYNDDKFEFSETCEKSCKNGMSVDDNCVECGERETQCVIEVVDGDDGTHNVAKYLLQSCEDGAWSAGEECADGGICAADGKGCINPADLEEELCPADGYYTCNTTFYSGTPLYVICYGGEVTPTACVGVTPTCSVAEQNCVEAVTCETGRVDNGAGVCVCDEANGYVEVEDAYSGEKSCVKACADGDVRCVTDELGSYLQTCYDNWFEWTSPCEDGCNPDNTGCADGGDTPPTCNVAGGAIYSDYDEACICDGESNYYGDPDPDTGACKKCPDDAFPTWGTTPGCKCEGGKTWNSETNTCDETTECTADAKKCVDGEGAYVCGADGTWGTPTACADGCDGEGKACKEDER